MTSTTDTGCRGPENSRNSLFIRSLVLLSHYVYQESLKIRDGYSGSSCEMYPL